VWQAWCVVHHFGHTVSIMERHPVRNKLLILDFLQIKTVLMLENKVYLPNRNFRKANPRIPLEEWKLKVRKPAVLKRLITPNPYCRFHYR
jgi:hypothetical protein